MQTRFVRLVALASLSVAGSAAANYQPPRVYNPTFMFHNCSLAPTLSPDGTTGTCTDKGWRIACNSINQSESRCGGLYANLFHHGVANTPTSLQIMPAELFGPGQSRDVAGQLYPAAAVPHTPVAPTTYPISGSAVTPTGATFGDATLANSFDPNQSQWAYANQNPRYAPRTVPIRSCAEYVWRKWGNYSWFDDVAKVAAHTFDLALHSATDGPCNGQSPNITCTPAREDHTGIDVARLTPLNEYNGLNAQGDPFNPPQYLFQAQVQYGDNTPMPYNQEYTNDGDIKRNAFFIGYPEWLDSNDPTQAAILAEFAALEFSDPTFAGNDLQWAATQMQNMAGVSEATFIDNERRLDAFSTLEAHLADVQNQIDQLVPLPRCIGQYCQWAAMSPFAQTPVVSNPAAPAFADHYFRSAAQRRQVAHAYLAAALPHIAATDAALKNGTFNYTGGDVRIARLKLLTADLIATEGEMTNAWIAEWNYPDHGCLGYPGFDMNSGDKGLAVNSCDFMPHLFADRYANLFQVERQNAYARCLADTSDDFRTLEQPAKQTLFDFDPNLKKQYNDSLDDIETYFTLYENRDVLNVDHDKKLSEIAGAFLKTTTDLPITKGSITTVGGTSSSGTIGETVGDTNSLGSDWFGGSFTYNAGWSVTPWFETTLAPGQQYLRTCSIEGSAGMSLSAEARILKQPISVLDAALKVTASRGASPGAPGTAKLEQAHFTIFGNDLDSTDFPNKDGTDLANEFYVAIDAPVGSVGFSAIIPVLFIPVQVEASIAVHVGTVVDAQVTAPPYCDANNPSFAIKGQLSPYITADVEAQADIDLGFASAGIEGKLNLITVNLPVAADVHITNDPNNNNRPSLAVETSADLRLTELSGSVVLFAEIDYFVGSERAEFPLFSWDGFHQDVPLFHRAKTYSLDAIDFRMNGGNSNYMNPN